MAKRLRNRPIYIAPEIRGYIDNNGSLIVLDEKNNNQLLDPNNINDKIHIYERQVMDWFLTPAYKLITYRNKNKGFIVLMICLSYLEGVEQYRQGRRSNRQSQVFFVNAMERLYRRQFSRVDLGDFYSEARCGLFHNGMVAGRIIINNTFTHSIEFDNGDIKVSPTKFLRDITNDFQSYLQELRVINNIGTRNNFSRMFSNI